jgi:T5SS/PEP-CTERM-associated repeat protein
VSSKNGYLGYHQDSVGNAAISGPGSTWTIDNSLNVGFSAGGAGNLNIHAGALVEVAEDTTIYASSQINLDGGTLATNAIKFQGSDAVFNWTSGTLHVGTYNGDLTNSAGILAPGRSPGATAVTGSYSQLSGGTLQIEIGGTTSATQYDLLSVESNATLGGTLQLSLINSFLPAQSDVFTILSASGNLTGAFANAPSGQRLMTTDGAGSFLVYYGAGSVYNPKLIVLTGFVPTTVPEPATMTLISALTIASFLARRRRT